MARKLLDGLGRDASHREVTRERVPVDVHASRLWDPDANVTPEPDPTPSPPVTTAPILDASGVGPL